MVSDYFEVMKRFIVVDFIVRDVFDCFDLFFIDVLRFAVSVGEYIRGLVAGLFGAWWIRYYV